MNKVIIRALPYLAAGVAGFVATPAAAVVAAAVDWPAVPLLGGLTLERRQALLSKVGRIADRLGLGTVGCALRRHASYLPYDQAARDFLGHIPPAELAQVLAEVRARTAKGAPPAAPQEG